MRYYLQEDMYVLNQILKKPARILDVGCGEGRYLIPLSATHQVLGVDINNDVIAGLTSKGFHAIHIDNISEIDEKFDYIILSHILEHLFPLEMLDFIDKCADLLGEEGAIIIATPLLYNEFYDDYDHIRPYTPKSIQLLFSDYVQHQKKPRNRLMLKNVWVRKWPHVLFCYSGEHRMWRLVKLCLNKILEFVFYISLGLVSRSTGWVGVFTKTEKA